MPSGWGWLVLVIGCVLGFILLATPVGNPLVAVIIGALAGYVVDWFVPVLHSA